MRHLLFLVLKNVNHKESKLSDMYADELEANLNLLQTLGEIIEAFLYPLVESSLPNHIFKAYGTLVGEADKSVDNKRLEPLIQFL